MTEKRKPELAPCPFCGGEPILNHIESHSHKLMFNGQPIMDDYPGAWTIECCDVGMIKDTREEVVAAWNRRTEPAGSADHINDASKMVSAGSAGKAGEREAFEKFVSDQGVAANYLGDGQYGFGVQLAWDAWQARSALAAPAQLSDEEIFELVAHELGNTLLAEDLREGFTIHTEAADWLKVARALLSAAQGKESGNG